MWEVAPECTLPARASRLHPVAMAEAAPRSYPQAAGEKRERPTLWHYQVKRLFPVEARAIR
jgi:hypothetical protein